MNNRLIIGWRNFYGRAEVRLRNSGQLIGWVRLSEDRWLPETPDTMPLEGTFRTRREAVDVVFDAHLAARSR